MRDDDREFLFQLFIGLGMAPVNEANWACVEELTNVEETSVKLIDPKAVLDVVEIDAVKSLLEVC